LTINPQYAADLLLQRMNTVLREVVHSNFGSSTFDALGSLYEAIGRYLMEMILECQNLPSSLLVRLLLC
ncbi:hypothetical protein PENTCL1PPCAC_11093, partial [Pristionchus entomophagus]